MVLHCALLRVQWWSSDAKPSGARQSARHAARMRKWSSTGGGSLCSRRLEAWVPSLWSRSLPAPDVSPCSVPVGPSRGGSHAGFVVPSPQLCSGHCQPQTWGHAMLAY